jgi:putative membrane protein
MRLLIRWIISSLAVFMAVLIVPGINVQGNAWVVIAVTAVILGLVNAIVRPILKFFSFPLIILTFGLFVFVINALTLWLTSYIAINWFHLGFIVDGLWSAFMGSLVISIVSVILTAIFRDEED